MLPDDIREKGTLVAGAEASYAPAEFLAGDGQTVIGFDADVNSAIGRVLGLEGQMESGQFAQIIPSIGSKYDVGISAITITSEREKEVHMISYLTAGASFAVAADNPMGVDTADLCGTSVAVQTGTFEDEDVKARATACTAAGKKTIDVLTYDSQANASTAVAGGKADVLYADSPIISYAIAQSDGALEQVGEVEGSAPYGIAVSKDDPQLAEAIQAATQKLMDDGTLEDILDAWGNGDAALTTAELDPEVD